MKTTAVLNENESVYLCKVQRPKETTMYEATIFATGVFDGATVTIQASPDQGTTKVNLKDVTGTVVSITSNDVYNVKLGDGSKNGDFIELYATMVSAGASSAVDLTVFDNM